MPFPISLALALVVGFGAALAGRVELRVSPRPMFLTGSFAALMLFTWLVLVPVCAYFYIFHGDWFLLYLMDVRRIPSALALLAFVFQGFLSMAAFGVAAALVRSQRGSLVGWTTGLILVLARVLWRSFQTASGPWAPTRSFIATSGLENFQDGALFQGTLALGGVLLLAALYLFYRLDASGKPRR